MNPLGQLIVPPRLLMGPGPSDAAPRVLSAMATPLVGHLDPHFLEIMNETQEMLRHVFRTTNRLTFPVSGTGMAGMETCLVNLVEPGDKVLVCQNGVFGERMADIAGRVGGQVTVITRPMGEVFELDQIRDVVKKTRPKVVGIVHAETSTGAWQPIEGLGALCHEFDALLLLDTVTSLGGVPVEIDAWGVDAVYSGTQKCLGCPPGLSPVSMSPRALETLAKRKSKVASWYLDLTMVQRYWEQERFYHHTAPISMIYALREALRMVLEEGLSARWTRHKRMGQALHAGLTGMGLTLATAPGHRLPQLTAACIPAGANDAATRERLLKDFGIEIGGGLGVFKGKVWRIGLMGYNARANNVLLFLAALESCLSAQGVALPAGAGVVAACRSLADSSSA